MALHEVTVRGELRPDGSLELHEPVELPPGEVAVSIRPMPETARASVWQTLDQIWVGQSKRGHVPRDSDAVETDVERLRAEWDVRSEVRTETGQ